MSLKLSYFPLAGRAQPTRACFAIGGIAFEDHRMSFADFKAAKETPEGKTLYPSGQLPALTLPSGKVITQSGAIARYAAKQAKLYPTDAEEALLVDEIIETVNDVITIPQATDAVLLKKLREDWVEGKLKKIYGYIASKLPADGKGFFVGGKLSLADIVFYGAVQILRSGMFDHVPTTYDSAWPAIAGFLAFMEADAQFGPQAAGFKSAPKA